METLVSQPRDQETTGSGDENGSALSAGHLIKFTQCSIPYRVGSQENFQIAKLGNSCKFSKFRDNWERNIEIEKTLGS